MPSTIPSTLGNALQQLDLHVGREHAAARSEQPQRRRVVPVGFGAQRRDEWARACVADEVQRVHALAFDQSEHVRHVDVRVGVEHELAAAEQRAERRPLAARVHERSERERDVLRPDRRRRTGGTHAVVARDCRRPTRRSLGVGDRRAAGVPAAERAEEDVFLAPHDALRVAGRAAGVQDVVVVAGARAEVARRAIRTPRTVRSVRARHRHRASTARDRRRRRGTRSPRRCSASSRSRARPGPCSSRACSSRCAIELRRHRPTCAPGSTVAPSALPIRVARSSSSAYVRRVASATTAARVRHRVGDAFEQIREVEPGHYDRFCDISGPPCTTARARGLHRTVVGRGVVRGDGFMSRERAGLANEPHVLRIHEPRDDVESRKRRVVHHPGRKHSGRDSQHGIPRQ